MLSCHPGLFGIATNCKHDFSWKRLFYFPFAKLMVWKLGWNSKITPIFPYSPTTVSISSTFLHTAHIGDIRPYGGGKGRDFQIQVVWFNILHWFLYRSEEIPCIPVIIVIVYRDVIVCFWNVKKSPQGINFLKTEFLPNVWKKEKGKRELRHSISTFKAVYSELSYQNG